MATEKRDDKVAMWLWWVLTGLSIALMLFLWWATKQTGGKVSGWWEKKQIAESGSVIKGTFAKTVKVPAGGWSEDIYNPHRAKLTWGRLDLSKGGTCEVMLNKDPKKVFPINAQTHIGPLIVQFRCSEEGAEVEVLGTPRT